MRFTVVLLVLSGWLLFPAILNGQDPDQQSSTSSMPNLFLDCSQCYQSYLKDNINLVNYVRDKADAQIHLLITRARTGSGGIEYTLSFLGQKNFKGMDLNLTYVSPQSDTNEERRVGLGEYVKIGLTSYLSRTSLVNYIGVNFSKMNDNEDNQVNPWNYWVFEISGFTSFSGEESRNSFEFDGEVSASRVTRKWKLEFEADGNYERSHFELDDDDTTFTQKRKQFSGLVVKSLSPHWSTGLSAEISSSSFRNIELEVGGSPAIEYNIFPYEEYNKHEFNFLYRISPTYFQYRDITIFNKTEEFLLEQSLRINYEVTQTWGSVRSVLTASNFMHDFSKNRLDFWGRVGLRIFRGFSLNFFGNYSLINDQFALPKEGATDEETLLRLRQQATGYEFRVGFGLSYSFGSIYNNIVNPRF